MKRAVLDREIDRLEQIGPTLIERFGRRSKEYASRTERLRAYRIERLRRDLNTRRRK